MKLKELKQESFQINQDIALDVSQLYFDYDDKEIYDLLKQNMLSNCIKEKIKAEPSESYVYKSNFLYKKFEEIQNNYEHFYFTLINSLTQLEQTTLFDVAMSQKDRNFAVTMLKNPEVKLTKEQFDKIFNIQLGKESYAFYLKKALIENKNIHFTREQINKGLVTYEDGLNASYAKRGETCIKSETIDQLLRMKEMYSSETLLQLLENKNLQLTHDQMEKLLTSERFDLKIACAENYQLSFTEEQIIRGLNDQGYDDSDGYDTTYEEFSQSAVVDAFMKNPNISIPDKEITNILNGKNTYAYAEDILHSNIKLQAEHIEMIINRYDWLTLEYLKHEKVKLNDQQILKMLYKDENWPIYLTQYYLSKEKTTVSELVLSVLKNFPDSEIKKVLETRGDSILENKNQNKPKM